MQKKAVPGRDAQSSVRNIMLCVPHLDPKLCFVSVRCVVSNGLSCVDQLENYINKKQNEKKGVLKTKKKVCASSRYQFPQCLIMFYKRTHREFVLGGKKKDKQDTLCSEQISVLLGLHACTLAPLLLGSARNFPLVLRNFSLGGSIFGLLLDWVKQTLPTKKFY